MVLFPCQDETNVYFQAPAQKLNCRYIWVVYDVLHIGCMSAEHMTFQAVSMTECLSTHATFIRFLSCVNPHVNAQVGLPVKRLSANITLVFSGALLPPISWRHTGGFLRPSWTLIQHHPPWNTQHEYLVQVLLPFGLQTISAVVNMCFYWK